MAVMRYAIALNVTTLFALTADDGMSGNLELDPFPNEFHEAYEQVATSGEGFPIECGFPWALWSFDTPVGSADWRLLMDFVGETAAVEVYISTRTNQITDDGEYQYRAYQAIMHRPTGDSYPHYRYDSIQVKFTKLRPV